jgi:hypothetical protein
LLASLKRQLFCLGIKPTNSANSNLILKDPERIQFANAGSGFGSHLSITNLNSTSLATDIQAISVDPTAFTFLAPPSHGMASLTLLLTVNDVNQSFSVDYSTASTPEVLRVVGSYPEGDDGVLILPASAAASLTILGSGFGEGTALNVSPPTFLTGLGKGRQNRTIPR